MKIKIKRATTEGLKDAEGDFFECNGIQFCLVKDEGLYFGIELSTGCNVKSFDSEIFTKKIAKDSIVEIIKTKTKSEWDKAFDMVSKDYCKKYKFTLPVNTPVLK